MANVVMFYVWCLLGALLGCVVGLRPVNVAFTLLIFILVFNDLVSYDKSTRSLHENYIYTRTLGFYEIVVHDKTV
jgi:hypothetical protein